MSTATQTANAKYQYDAVHYGKTIDEYVAICHKELSKQSGWRYFPLKKGAFGYDNMAMSVGHFFDNYKAECSIDHYASLIHEGWAINYTYWRDHKPFVTKPDTYFKPANALGDARRNQCAITAFDDLPSDEKQKDIVVANAILSSMNTAR